MRRRRSPDLPQTLSSHLANFLWAQPPRRHTRFTMFNPIMSMSPVLMSTPYDVNSTGQGFADASSHAIASGRVGALSLCVSHRIRMSSLCLPAGGFHFHGTLGFAATPKPEDGKQSSTEEALENGNAKEAEDTSPGVGPNSSSERQDGDRRQFASA